ncbi:Putative AC9 transposase [Apostasia shenzhenica]|uniref:AC9 transposase n=1 Tax=Apostasia shenzhenica TaxID=1088818 RepID=A0A2I0AEY6_9ASPA|nr:Putative AC9 transposase [Apostasia shenzhenica]
MDKKANLDILAYWKCNQYRYPEVASMAPDILSIPTSTVASKSTFSGSGKVLDQYRSSLTPNILEVLMCSRDWLYGQHGIHNTLFLFNLIQFLKVLLVQFS